jgi:hypothetical protein
VADAEVIGLCKVPNIFTLTTELVNTEIEEKIEMNLIIKSNWKETTNVEVVFESTITKNAESIQINCGELNENPKIQGNRIIFETKINGLSEKNCYLSAIVSNKTEILKNELTQQIKKLETLELNSDAESAKLILASGDIQKIILEIKKTKTLITNAENTLSAEQTLTVLITELQNQITKAENEKNLALSAGLDVENASEIIELAKQALVSEEKTKILEASKKLVGVNASYLDEMNSLIEKAEKEVLKKSESTQNLFNEKKASYKKNVLTDFQSAITAFEEAKQLVYLDETKIVNLSELNECEKLLALVESQIKGKEMELIKQKFWLPITYARLQKIKELIDNIKLGGDATELGAIKTELTEAYASIKKQAATKFNNALDAQKDEAILTEAKNLFDSNRYVDSFLALSANTPMQSIKLEILAPILLIIFGAGALAYYSRKRNEENKKIKSVCLEEWDELK